MGIEDRWAKDISRWFELWNVSGLERELTFIESQRMRTSLGSCNIEGGQIRLASFLIRSNHPLTREVICHEVAHAAVVRLYGSRMKPHGKEWQTLMSSAGYKPRSSLLAGGHGKPSTKVRSNQLLWQHHCPVCQMKKFAGRPVPQWRCKECQSFGLDGKLFVSHLWSGDSNDYV